MEENSLQEKMHAELKEVIYTNANPDKLNTQYLRPEKKSNHFLYLSAVTADLLIFVVGSGFSWSSVASSSLRSPDSLINPVGGPVTHVQESWIASLYCLGAAIGPLFAGKLADLLGRKKTLLLIAVPQVVSLAILAYASDVLLFYVLRFVVGLSAGTTFSTLPIYLVEISEIHNKGQIGCLMGVMLTLGVLYPFLIGPFLSLKNFTLSCTVPSLLFLAIFSVFIPESPVYLASRGRKEEAKKAFLKLRFDNASLAYEELRLVEETLKSEKQEQGTEKKSVLADRGVRMAFVISIGLLVSQQLSGINAVVAFLHPIFEQSGSSMSTYVSTVLIGIIQVAGTVLAAMLVEKLGRKILLLISSLLSCVSITTLGLYFYVKSNNILNADSIFWLPIASLMIFITAFNFGLGSLPWTITSEIFPSNVHSLATSIGSFCCFFTSFLVTLGFPLLENVIGMAKCFWLFGICLAVISILIFAFVPETKGKTSSEIQELLRGK